MSQRYSINLASEPFRRDRPLLAASVALGVILLGLAGLLGWMVVQERGRLAETRGVVDRMQRDVALLDTEQAKLDGQLREPRNAAVLERSLMLNTLLTRKGISWNRIFSDLDQVMPYNVKLIQVRLPQVNQHNEVLLDMIVGAQSPEPVLDLLKKLEMSPRFGPTSVHTSLPPTENEPLYRYRVSVTYAQKL